MSLRFHKIVCRVVIGHWENDELVSEEESQRPQDIYSVDQFEEYLVAVKDEIDRRNSANQPVAAS